MRCTEAGIVPQAGSAQPGSAGVGRHNRTMSHTASTMVSSTVGVERTALLALCNELLQPERFKDYGPNGLQVEGRAQVRHLVSGVTASRALMEAAIADGADAILVHHGLFWRGMDGRITGWMKERLRLLLAHDINLIAYHLPLDAHPLLGNNAQLGRVLGVAHDATFGEQDLGLLGTCQFAHAAALVAHVEAALGRRAIWVSGAPDAPITRLAWCTGGAQGFFESAVAAGAQAFITGEISEPQAHLAREMGVTFIAAGHHATERYGAAALGAQVAQTLGIGHRFIDIDNPA